MNRYLKFSSVLLPLFAVACSGNQTNLRQELDDLRSVQAEQSTGIAQLRTELRELSGKVEELQFQNKNKTAELERSLRTVSSRVPPPPGVPEDLLNADEQAIAPTTGPAADSYRQALQQVRTGEFDGARQTLQAFIDANPETAFTDNALFWLGITFERQNQLDRAVVAYGDVFKRFPAEDMVPPALFHLGEAFVQMGSFENALVTFQKLVDEHPRSQYVVQAKARIKELSAPKKSGSPRKRR